jgi:tyrosyl-tRNA synthetase
MHVLDTLISRGFIQQSTDMDALRESLSAGSVSFYVGFDPTGDSLHVGHLLPVMAMAHLQRAGHRPIIVLGGGTAMVGDPSGKDKTREIITEDQIRHNMAGQQVQFGRFLNLSDLGEDDGPVMVDNGEWLKALNYIEFLRDIGKHFSVNRMLSAESARQRLERNQGLSFIEFNYHLLQSYDFLVLHERYGCTLQLGGDDQWFNILGGADLIRRERGRDVHALTVPLLTTADGKKMGKTERGAVWLDAKQLSPYDYFQYWINVHDADVGRFLRLYTFMELSEIEKLEALQGAEIRKAKQVLAYETTKLAHGGEEAERALKAAREVFSGAGSRDMPTIEMSLPVSIIDILVTSQLAKSRGAARRLIQQGGARIGRDKVTDVDAVLEDEGVVWAGKKRAVKVVAAS